MCLHVCVYVCLCVCLCVKAARRELEHQRQLEWERQRRDQLMAETQREHSQVDRLRLEIGQHRQELDIVVRPSVMSVSLKYENWSKGTGSAVWLGR